MNKSRVESSGIEQQLNLVAPATAGWPEPIEPNQSQRKTALAGQKRGNVLSAALRQ